MTLPCGAVPTLPDPDFSIFFCPVCDRFTPEDLEVTDTRTIIVPRPNAAEPLQFFGAEDYRTTMGPNRPFQAAGSRTMRRRYDTDGVEITDT